MSAPYVDELCKRLEAEQAIVAPYTSRETGKPDPEDLRLHVTETGHVFVNFESRPGQGVTSLNSPLRPENYTLTDTEMKFVGERIVLNGTPVRVHAAIQLATMTGRGRVEVLSV
eukprot:EG_transcript_49223